MQLIQKLDQESVKIFTLFKYQNLLNIFVFFKKFNECKFKRLKSMNNKEKLRQAILKILNLTKLKLFGCLIYNFKINIIGDEIFENYNISEKELSIIKQPLTACASIIDKKPHIDIYEWFITENTVEELEFILLHEILHVLDGDLHRCGKRNQKIFNYASDHVINTTLKKSVAKKEIPLSIPKSIFTIDELKNKDLTKEEVYEYLMENTTEETVMFENGEIIVSTLKVNGKKIIVATDIQHSEVKEVSETLKAEARAVQSMDGKGSSSGVLSKLIDKIIQIKIPWNNILMNVIATKVVPSCDTKSWRNINKKLYPHKIYLPGQDYDTIPDFLIILVDTSGSISDIDLKKFGGLIFQSSSYFDLIRIIKHDVKIQDDITIPASEFATSDVIYKYKGRGGTSHKYVFNAVEKSYEDGDEISMVLALTDFESDIDQLWKNYKWHKEIPFKLILTKHTNVPKYIDEHPIVIKD